MQKTKRQRAIEQEKEAKRSRKSSSTKKQNKDEPFVDDVSSEDFENPAWRTKGKKKTSSHTQTQKNRRDPEKSNVVESKKQVRKARKEKKKTNATKSIKNLLVVVVIPMSRSATPRAVQVSRGMGKTCHSNHENGKITTNA